MPCTVGCLCTSIRDASKRYARNVQRFLSQLSSSSFPRPRLRPLFDERGCPIGSRSDAQFSQADLKYELSCALYRFRNFPWALRDSGLAVRCLSVVALLSLPWNTMFLMHYAGNVTLVTN
jgi:hypothetical protein